MCGGLQSTRSPYRNEHKLEAQHGHTHPKIDFCGQVILGRECGECGFIITLKLDLVPGTVKIGSQPQRKKGHGNCPMTSKSG